MADSTKTPDSATGIVKQFLDQYGLGSLATWAMGVYTGAGGGTIGLNAITADLPSTKEFQTRFPAYQQMAEQGRAMSINEMLSYEQTARQIFQANGIPKGFYDTPDQLAKFMLNDVSTSELEGRVKDAQAAMVASPPDVRDQLQRFYNVDAGHLTSFFLDPTTAEPILQQKFTAAQIAAEAQRTAFGQIDQTQAEHLAQLNVTDAQAQSGFNKLGTQAGLFQAQVAGEQAIGTDEQISAQFEGNSAAQLAFQRRQASRVADFQGSSGFSAGQKGVAGIGPSDASSG